MMDELPMIYATALQLYVLVQSFPPEKSKVLVVTVLSTYCVIVTVAYLYLKNPIFHEVCYGFLAVLAAVYPILQIRTLADVQDLKGSDAIRNLYKLYFRSVFSYLFGFLLWNIENQNCNFFRQWRAGVGYPLRVFGELHMYWHLFTGIASYGLYIMAGYIRLLVLRRRDVKMVWYAGIIPVLQSDLPRSRILELDAVKKTA
ncbi:hypothetical protein HK101_006598 [Irineochytrium annulatum]|nr:hypothetical protein HK101_006598 [Irineochytrium annulatum]